MNNYELALVIAPNLEEEARTELLQKVQDYITRFGGTIENVDEWGKKRLAYEINKITEGFYYFIKFQSEASAPAEIERNLRIMEPVMRYLITRLEA